MVPVIDSFFEMRLKIDGQHELKVRKTIKLLSKISAFAQEKSYIKNVNQLFKTLYKIPQLKELSDGVKNQSIQATEKKKSGEPAPPVKVGRTGAISNRGEEFNTVNKAMKLKAMMKCAVQSD